MTGYVSVSSAIAGEDVLEIGVSSTRLTLIVPDFVIGPPTSPGPVSMFLTEP